MRDKFSLQHFGFNRNIMQSDFCHFSSRFYFYEVYFGALWSRVLFLHETEDSHLTRPISMQSVGCLLFSLLLVLLSVAAKSTWKQNISSYYERHNKNEFSLLEQDSNELIPTATVRLPYKLMVLVFKSTNGTLRKKLRCPAFRELLINTLIMVSCWLY